MKVTDLKEGDTFTLVGEKANFHEDYGKGRFRTVRHIGHDTNSVAITTTLCGEVYTLRNDQEVKMMKLDEIRKSEGAVMTTASTELVLVYDGYNNLGIEINFSNAHGPIYTQTLSIKAAIALKDGLQEIIDEGTRHDKSL